MVFVLNRLANSISRIGGAINANRPCIKVLYDKQVIQVLKILYKEGIISNYVVLHTDEILVYFKNLRIRGFKVFNKTRYSTNVTYKQLREISYKYPGCLIIISTIYGIALVSDIIVNDIKIGGNIIAVFEY